MMGMMRFRPLLKTGVLLILLVASGDAAMARMPGGSTDAATTPVAPSDTADIVEKPAVTEATAEEVVSKAAEEAVSKAAEEAVSKAAFKEHSCELKLVLCLASDLEGFRNDEAPKKIHAGDSLTVIVIEVSNTGVSKADYSVVVDHGSARDVLFGGKQVVGIKVPLADGETIKSFKAHVRHTKKVSFSVAADVLKSEITAQRVADDSDTGERTFLLAIVHGRYYLQVGVLVPFVINGQRAITGAPTGDATRVTPNISREVAITGALSLTIIPWGRDKGRLSSFEAGGLWPNIYQGFGFQLAKDFNFSALGDWYFGALFQPITGVSVSAGWSLRQGEFFKDGIPQRAIFESESLIPKSERYMLAPYVGVTFTQEVLVGILDAFKGFKKLQSNDQPEGT